MFCIIETLVRRDWSGKWSEHGRRARVIYNLETLETSNGIRTNVLQQKLGLVSRTTNTMLGLMQYPQGLGLVSHTTNTMLGLTQYPQGLGLVSHTTNTMLGLMQYPQGLGLVSHTTNMW